MDTTTQIIQKVNEAVIRYRNYQIDTNRPLHEIIESATVDDVSNSIILSRLEGILQTLQMYQKYSMDPQKLLGFRLKELKDDKDCIIKELSTGATLSTYNQARLMAIYEFETVLSLEDMFSVA